METIKIGIVCGCLPKQFGIESELLYHQLLQKKTESQFGITLEVSSIWYTTLSESNSKSIELIKLKNPSLLIYHVRPDPFLRMSKSFVRYNNYEEISKIKLNYNADDSMIFDKENNEQAAIHRKKKSLIKLFLLHLNYFLGYIIGTYNRGTEKEVQILNNLVYYCNQENITLFIVGPASRPRSIIENTLLYKLEKKLFKQFEQNHYISCYGNLNQEGHSIFMDDKVHLNQKGHIMISQLILAKFKKVIVKD